MQKKVVNGCFENLPELESTVVRVFFSSTFTGTRHVYNINIAFMGWNEAVLLLNLN